MLGGNTPFIKWLEGSQGGCSDWRHRNEDAIGELILI